MGRSSLSRTQLVWMQPVSLDAICEHFASRFQLSVAFFSDHLAESCESVGRSNGSNRTVQSNGFVVFHALCKASLGLLLLSGR
jgi:hypothetical protein